MLFVQLVARLLLYGFARFSIATDQGDGEYNDYSFTYSIFSLLIWACIFFDFILKHVCFFSTVRLHMCTKQDLVQLPLFGIF